MIATGGVLEGLLWIWAFGSFVVSIFLLYVIVVGLLMGWHKR